MVNQLYLKPDEGKFLAISVVAVLEDCEKSSKKENINWTPEARKQLKEMIEAGKSLSIKLKKLGFDMKELPPFIEGDQDEFLTKES